MVEGMNPIRKKQTVDIVIEAQEKEKKIQIKKLSNRSIQIAADKTANG